jgi:hypothetical protein
VVTKQPGRLAVLCVKKKIAAPVEIVLGRLRKIMRTLSILTL